MAGVRRLEGAAAPVNGHDEFSVQVHHGGFFCGSFKDQVYLDGKVDWFDNCKVQYWCFSSIEEISLMLGYGIEKLTVLWLLPEMVVPSGLRIVDSDSETIVMKQVAYKVNTFVYETNWQNVGGSEVKPPKYEKKPGRPAKARKKAPHEVQGRNGPRLSKHGVAMHCSHCGKGDHNAARCAAKKAGEPAVQKRKRAAAEESRYQEEYQEVFTAEAETETNMSQVDNPMLSQLLDEASQTVRQHPVSQPIPDSAYILSHVPPPPRQIHLTTATKAGKTSKTKKAGNTSRSKKGPSGQ